MLIVLAFIIFSVCETGEHLCFARSNGPRGAWIWIVAGCALYLTSLGSWLWILSVLPLSIALPVSGLNYVSVAICSRLWLGEEITTRRALGIAIIIAGVAVIGFSGGAELL